MVDPTTGYAPFPMLSNYRIPRDPYGRFPGGCVTRQHSMAQHVPGVVEVVDLLTRMNTYGKNARFGTGFRGAMMAPHAAVHYMVCVCGDLCGPNPATVRTADFRNASRKWQACNGFTRSDTRSIPCLASPSFSSRMALNSPTMEMLPRHTHTHTHTHITP